MRVCVLAFIACIALLSAPVEVHGQFPAYQGPPGVLNELARPPEYLPTSTTGRTSDLEARLAVVESELAKRQPAAKPPAAPKPTFQIGGQLQVDYLWIDQDAVNRATVGDVNNAVDVRRARFVARGEYQELIEYILGVDFGLAGRPSFLDVWVGARELPYLGHLRVGHFFEPFSLERLTQNQRTTFMERSLADAFAPARNVGIEAHDAFGDDDRATYAIGWFAANSGNFGEQFTDAGGQAVTSRFSWLPFWDATSAGRSFIHLGVAHSYRRPVDGNLSYAAFPEARSGVPSAASLPTFVNTGNIKVDHSQLFGAEFAWVAGPFYVQSEYIAAPIDQAAGPNLFFDAAYVNVSFFLTGENRTYNKQFGSIDRVHPFEDFFRVRTGGGSIVTGKGAWEVATRYSVINLNDANIQGGNLRDITFGLNWYLNAYTRVKWEIIHADLDRAPFGQSEAWIGGMRFDIDF